MCGLTRAAVIPIYCWTRFFNAQNPEDSAEDLPKELPWLSQLRQILFLKEFVNSRMSVPSRLFVTSHRCEISHPSEFRNFGYLSSFSGISSFRRTLQTTCSSGIPSHDHLPSGIAFTRLSHHRNHREIPLKLLQVRLKSF
jgi:hypothetical protein